MAFAARPRAINGFPTNRRTCSWTLASQNICSRPSTVAIASIWAAFSRSHDRTGVSQFAFDSDA
jgi:hypothetical protein